MDGAAMDAYLSNPVIQYVEYTGTLAISGYYYNVTVDGAATAVGSLAYVIEGTVDPALDGQKILVKGWTIGFSGGKYVNTMITSVTAADGGTTEPEPEPEPEPTPEPGDVFVITFPGNPSKYTNSYTDSFTIEVGSNAFVFSGINNGQESNAWTAVRFGRKANDSVATIATSNAISYAVSSVKINFTQVDTEMNSAKLIVASDSDFTNVVEEVTAELAVGEVVYTVTSPAENLYYKLEYDMPLTGTNGSYRFDKVTYAK
jgi:hypothetical protein